MKSMLEQCDYHLAAEVIKEKFQNIDSGSAIAVQIEQFLADPCFRTAIELIESDSLFIYYFTESKPDGLYARRLRKQPPYASGEQDDARATALRERGMLWRSMPQQADYARRPDEDGEPEARESAFRGEQSAREPEGAHEAAAALEVAEAELRPPKTSESRENALRRAHPAATEGIEAADSPAAEMPSAPAFRGRFDTQSVRQPGEPRAVRQPNAERPEGVHPPVGVPDERETARRPPNAAEGREAAPQQRASGRSLAAARANGAAADSSAMPRADRFPNVIMTLKDDVEQLREQVKYFERMVSLSRLTGDEAQMQLYEEQLKKFRDGIAEFEEAIRLLQS
jgi:hypothetical protein